MGDREAHLRHAVRRLGAAGRVTGVSSVYETDPVGFLDQDPFLNLVVRLETTLDPMALLERAREIEAERGRERRFRNAPRTLDIDLLLYGDRTVRSAALEVPHPRMADRPFVLVPLLELEPEARDPATGRRLGERLVELAGERGIGQLPGIRRARAAAEFMEGG